MVQNLVEFDNYKLLRQRLGKEPLILLEKILKQDRRPDEKDRNLMLKCLFAFNYTNEMIFKQKNCREPLSLLRCLLRPNGSKRGHAHGNAHHGRKDSIQDWHRSQSLDTEDCEMGPEGGYMDSGQSAELTILLFSQLSRHGKDHTGKFFWGWV